MKKSLFGLIILFVFLTTYSPKLNNNISSNFYIKRIIVQDNLILKSNEIKKELDFLYTKNLFFLDIKKVENKLSNFDLIESFRLKKIYPNTLTIFIVEKKPIAILQNQKKKFYISDKGELINFTNIRVYKDLPTVFGKGEFFFTLYQDLKSIKFPLEDIKSFYFFESGRWDLLMLDDKLIKLPVKDYLTSLKNYMEFKKNDNYKDYKTFDYRIGDQLILN
tara:strand:- start:476 stop:1135 length:660 start_codon:yes stop_codon:yes gene_type:complete